MTRARCEAWRLVDCLYSPHLELKASECSRRPCCTAPDVTVVGSQTAGADGNISLIVLPGGIQTYISGLAVFYPDGTNTQRLGIGPDIVAVPTIDGIQNGVDEVLERAPALVR